jgi:hypothetical protein
MAWFSLAEAEAEMTTTTMSKRRFVCHEENAAATANWWFETESSQASTTTLASEATSVVEEDEEEEEEGMGMCAVSTAAGIAWIERVMSDRGSTRELRSRVPQTRYCAVCNDRIMGSPRVRYCPRHAKSRGGSRHRGQSFKSAVALALRQKALREAKAETDPGSYDDDVNDGGGGDEPLDSFVAAAIAKSFCRNQDGRKAVTGGLCRQCHRKRRAGISDDGGDGGEYPGDLLFPPD